MVGKAKDRAAIVAEQWCNIIHSYITADSKSLDYYSVD
jgi:hypothetical protein